MPLELGWSCWRQVQVPRAWGAPKENTGKRVTNVPAGTPISELSLYLACSTFRAQSSPDGSYRTLWLLCRRAETTLAGPETAAKSYLEIPHVMVVFTAVCTPDVLFPTSWSMTWTDSARHASNLGRQQAGNQSPARCKVLLDPSALCQRGQTEGCIYRL